MNHKDYSRTTSTHNNITHQQSSMDLENKNPWGFSGVLFVKEIAIEHSCLRIKMLMELLLVLPIYAIFFVVFFRFSPLIKAMTEANEILTDLFPKSSDANSCVNKREFLIEKIKNGESISNSKTPWTEERLEKASDRTIERLYDKYENPPPVKVDKQEALKLGKPVCPVVIELYAEGLKSIFAHIPYVGGRYTINVEKLKANISSNELFCDNLAIKIGSKMIEQMGSKSPMQMGVSLASMTWDAVETASPLQPVPKSDENKDPL